MDEEDLKMGEGHAKGREKQEVVHGILPTLPHLCGPPSASFSGKKIHSTPANTQSINSISKKGSFPLNLFIFWEPSLLHGILTCSI